MRGKLQSRIRYFSSPCIPSGTRVEAMGKLFSFSDIFSKQSANYDSQKQNSHQKIFGVCRRASQMVVTESHPVYISHTRAAGKVASNFCIPLGGDLLPRQRVKSLGSSKCDLSKVVLPDFCCLFLPPMLCTLACECLSLSHKTCAIHCTKCNFYTFARAEKQRPPKGSPDVIKSANINKQQEVLSWCSVLFHFRFYAGIPSERVVPRADAIRNGIQFCCGEGKKVYLSIRS